MFSFCRFVASSFRRFVDSLFRRFIVSLFRLFVVSSFRRVVLLYRRGVCFVVSYRRIVISLYRRIVVSSYRRGVLSCRVVLLSCFHFVLSCRAVLCCCTVSSCLTYAYCWLILVIMRIAVIFNVGCHILVSSIVVYHAMLSFRHIFHQSNWWKARKYFSLIIKRSDQWITRDHQTHLSNMVIRWKKKSMNGIWYLRFFLNENSSVIELRMIISHNVNVSFDVLCMYVMIRVIPTLK